MSADYLYHGLLIRWGSRPLAIIDAGEVERLSPDWTGQELEMVAAFIQLPEAGQDEYLVQTIPGPAVEPVAKPATTAAPDGICIVPGCGQPRYTGSHGNRHRHCREHVNARKAELSREKYRDAQLAAPAPKRAKLESPAPRGVEHKPLPYTSGSGRNAESRCRKFHGVVPGYELAYILCGWSAE